MVPGRAEGGPLAVSASRSLKNPDRVHEGPGEGPGVPRRGSLPRQVTEEPEGRRNPSLTGFSGVGRGSSRAEPEGSQSGPGRRDGRREGSLAPCYGDSQT